MALPHIKWLNISHNFGAFSEDLGTVNCKFVGVNTGDDTLVIYDVKTNCGCTTTGNYSGKEYEPGDTIVIEAAYSATGRPGRFTKKVLVTSNADTPKSSLTLYGTVIGAPATLSQRYPVEKGPVRLASSMALLGEIGKGRTGGAYIKSYNQSADTLTPIVVKAPKYFNVIVEPATVNPGEQFVISLNHHTGRDSRWGLHGDTIMVLPLHKGETPETTGESPFELTTVITMKEDFNSLSDAQKANPPVITIDNPVIDLKRITIDNTKPITGTIKVSNTGKRDLMLRSVTCAHPAVTLSDVPVRIKPGKKAEIKITVDPEKLKGAELLDARIMIIANDPANPNTIVRMVGEIL